MQEVRRVQTCKLGHDDDDGHDNDDDDDKDNGDDDDHGMTMVMTMMSMTGDSSEVVDNCRVMLTDEIGIVAVPKKLLEWIGLCLEVLCGVS